MRKGEPGYEEHLAYKRNRRREIQAGTWHPHKPEMPVFIATEADLEWAAGFLEGEGSFVKTKSGGRVSSANQRYTPEPLQRLQGLFGGSLRWRDGERRWNWYACGWRAVGLMLSIYPYLSKRRQRQIQRVLRVGDVTT